MPFKTLNLDNLNKAEIRPNIEPKKIAKTVSKTVILAPSNNRGKILNKKFKSISIYPIQELVL